MTPRALNLCKLVSSGCALVCTIVIATVACGAVRHSPARQTPIARWRMVETANFRIYSFGLQSLDPGVSAHCEALRAELVRRWFKADAVNALSPKCIVVVHSTHGSYRAAAGPLADCTMACCTIRADGVATVLRRIDVRASHGPWVEHLPHELTHLLLDGQLICGDLPRWADEGMALLADPPEKRAQHANDLRAALRDGRQFRLAELLALADYPDRQRLGVFYGQSLSLVEYLYELGGGHKLAEFVRAGSAIGYDAALQAQYGINSVADLESRWLASVNATTTGPTVSQMASNRDSPGTELGAAERASAQALQKPPAG